MLWECLPEAQMCGIVVVCVPEMPMEVLHGEGPHARPWELLSVDVSITKQAFLSLWPLAFSGGHRT